MDFVQLNIAAIRQSDSQNNVYVLLLNETVGKRQLPIVIGWCEARSIAIALDGTEDSGRPLTHDLFKTFGDSFDITIQKSGHCTVILKFMAPTGAQPPNLKLNFGNHRSPGDNC